jgi:hypothetical protein
MNESAPHRMPRPQLVGRPPSRITFSTGISGAVEDVLSFRVDLLSFFLL